MQKKKLISSKQLYHLVQNSCACVVFFLEEDEIEENKDDKGHAGLTSWVISLRRKLHVSALQASKSSVQTTVDGHVTVPSPPPGKHISNTRDEHKNIRDGSTDPSYHMQRYP